jgi:hypothetical protein
MQGWLVFDTTVINQLMHLASDDSKQWHGYTCPQHVRCTSPTHPPTVKCFDRVLPDLIALSLSVASNPVPKVTLSTRITHQSRRGLGGCWAHHHWWPPSQSHSHCWAVHNLKILQGLGPRRTRCSCHTACMFQGNKSVLPSFICSCRNAKRQLLRSMDTDQCPCMLKLAPH